MPEATLLPPLSLYFTVHHVYVESVHVDSLLAKQSLKTRIQQHNFSNPDQSIVSPSGDNIGYISGSSGCYAKKIMGFSKQ